MTYIKECQLSKVKMTYTGGFDGLKQLRNKETLQILQIFKSWWILKICSLNEANVYFIGVYQGVYYWVL